MKEIIAPIERGKIEAELTPERFLRHTNKGGNDIYVVNYKNAPNTMQEIGRLREIAFRAAGGGTGKGGDERAFAAGIGADGAVFDRDIVFVGKEAGQIRRGKRL